MIMEERKLKKRILFALLAVVMVVALAACGGNTDADKEDANKITIESTARARIKSASTAYGQLMQRMKNSSLPVATLKIW